ncbi:MAG TPA: UDP-2,3-diacylglucosamine diphosphatase [Candidatus Krumholzibacteria bacterium]|nr:UDP-2,3-diacylglucosamine diphosphatase [Candidatus Krumholzibacteria bacterium]
MTPTVNQPVVLRAPDVRMLADTHFRDVRIPGERERRERFIRFLDNLPGNSALFLLGDIFDFYFEYRSVVSRRYLDVCSAIRRASDRGIPVHFLGGNHDHWVGDRFASDLGVVVHQRDIMIEAQGRRILLAHGDLVMPRDYGYKMLKQIIRNPVVVALARAIHPDILDAIAGGVSHGSRTYLTVPQEKRARTVTAYAWNHFFLRGNDAFVMGHVHYPLHETKDGREFVILGDWIEHFTFARLTNGRLRLETVKS